MLPAVLLLAAAASAADWEGWLKNFGHDDYLYPDWVNAQREACVCTPDLKCSTSYTPGANEISFCVAKQWLLERMPKKDLYSLPPPVSITGTNMLDDAVIFSMMADKATPWATQTDLAFKMAYQLPYTNLMESVVNQRPLMFAKYIARVANANSTLTAIQQLIFPDQFTLWTQYEVDGMAPKGDYVLNWTSSTSPPVVGGFDFVAYGYGSCSAWAGELVNAARAVGIPARVVGSPCWNSGDYAGLATQNANVSHCWHGGPPGSNKGPVGNTHLWNHNWVEFWDSEHREWSFINAPPESQEPNVGWHCPGFNRTAGCCGGGQASGASLDHPIFAYTWSLPADLPGAAEGGGIVAAANLTLTTGESVSPLVWSPYMVDAFGTKPTEYLRMVNRTDFYRCKA